MAAASAPSCPMQRIPLEVMLRITYHLTTTDLGSFRLTCRSIEQSLYNTFTREYFTRKQFMVSEGSLQTLIDIAKSRLGHHLTHVHLGLECFPEGMHRPLQDEEKEGIFRQRYARHFSLWNMGYHREMLVEAFANLKNLQDVVIRDFNSRRRSRDGFNAEWTSYGSTTFFNETGVRLNQGHIGAWNSTYPSHYCAQVFAAVVAALGRAGARPQGIEVMSRNGNHLRDFAFDIPTFAESSIVPVLQGLKKLHLCVDFTWRNGAHSWQGGQTAPYVLIRKFLSHCQNLENLRINENHNYNQGLDQMLQWLAAPVPQSGKSASPQPAPASKSVISSPPSILLPRLEELSLGTMKVEAGHLLSVIQKFSSSLKRLELWKITLLRNQPDGTSSPPKVIFWTKFFERLKDMPKLNLHHIKAGMLQQQWGREPHHIHVTFKNTGPVKEYTGPDWKHFVGEITGQLEANWPLDRDESDEDDTDYLDDDGFDVDEMEDDEDDDAHISTLHDGQS